MDGSAFKELERIFAEHGVVEVDGLQFTPRDFKPVFFEPRPLAIDVRSLTAIVDYLKENRDGLELPDLIAHVQSAVNVSLMSKLTGKDRKRDSYIDAEYDGTVFKFGAWMQPEAFIIAMNALFIPNTDRDRILNYVSRISISDEGTILDDGITQSAQVKVGVKGNLTETQAAPARVILVPFRSFREIEQPESEFIFRMRRSGGSVELSLHEADGGAWKAVAMDRIKKYLEEEFLKVKPSIPVAVIA